MRSKFLPFLFFTFTFYASLASANQRKNLTSYSLRTGDIVFQSGDTLQARAIKEATQSKWTHVGIIFFYKKKPWVLEAVNPVKTTPLRKFINRCPSDFYAMRLKNSFNIITPLILKKAEKYAKQQLGKPYDASFRWSGETLYCSELVWKIYKYAAGIELCKPRLLKSYKLNRPNVKSLIKKRYGSTKNLPLKELMVAPSDIALSPLLREVPSALSPIPQ